MTDARDTDAEGRPRAVLLDPGLAPDETDETTTATVLLANIVHDTVRELARAFGDRDVAPRQPVDDAVREELARHGYRLAAYERLTADVDAGGETVTARLRVSLTNDDAGEGDVEADTSAPRRSEPADFGGGETTGVQTL